MSEESITIDAFNTVIRNIDSARQRRFKLISRESTDESLNRPVQLLLVTKTVDPLRIQSVINYCYEKNIPALIGENYVQEYENKRAHLYGAFKAHCIGPLQSNKIKKACMLFDVIQSVHSFKILQAINNEASRLCKIQDVFLQVNISEDSNKSGFSRSEAFILYCKYIQSQITLESVRINGFMLIPKLYDTVEETRKDFRKMLAFKHELLEKLYGASEDRAVPQEILLSMGMSHDYEAAIEEGADFVRVGSAIFGERV
jgi:PLP dependent protein